MTQPPRHSPSVPTGDGYEYKKRFYQSDEVAADYDQHRFTTPERQRRNQREWQALTRALDRAGNIGTILDIPCGTGRFTGDLVQAGYTVIGGDISIPMMKQAKAKPAAADPKVLGFVQADAENLPLADDSVDCVMSIRFMHHVDSATRRRMLRDMGRVSRRWLIIDYRHRYSIRWAIWRIGRALGLTRKPLDRVSSQGLRDEFSDAGLRIVEIFPSRRLLSDKWMVLAETQSASAARGAAA